LTERNRTANTLSEIEQRLQQLTNSVLAGKAEEARQSTYAALARGSTTNEVLDALLEAVNIFVDLYDVGEYDQSKLASTENAVNFCLQVVEDRLVKSEGKFNLRATVGPVGKKGGAILALALVAILRSIGFQATCLGKTQTALELLRNSEELGVDLVIPLLADGEIEAQLHAFVEEIDRGGFRSKFEVIPVAPNLATTVHMPMTTARNSGEAISKATEWALKRQSAHKGE
jgi:methanogenic corrinoid protein MtbC1